jgi:hypothetical protein
MEHSWDIVEELKSGSILTRFYAKLIQRHFFPPNMIMFSNLQPDENSQSTILKNKEIDSINRF